MTAESLVVVGKPLVARRVRMLNQSDAVVNGVTASAVSDPSISPLASG